MTRIERASEEAIGTPRLLLWAIGGIALVLGATAFVLWGTRAGDFIFDLVVAYCA